MSFADRVKKMVKDAPTARTGVNVNFGPMKITPMIITFKGKGNMPDKETLKDYMERNDIDEKDDFELGKQESFQLHVDIDVSDLNPTLAFHYERDIAVLESNVDEKKPDKSIFTDWSETFLPSLEKVFGSDWYEKLISNGKKAAPVVWVAAENVDSLKPVAEGGKNYGVPKLLAVYKDRDACVKARDERYPPREEKASEGSEGEEVAEGEFSTEILESVIALFTSARKNKKTTITMLKGNPFNIEEEFDPEELLEKALAYQKEQE